jgi:type VII secretion integral membrane protein EccD
MTAPAPEMTRLTIVTPNRWADLALPANEPLASLMPPLIDKVGDADLENELVVLQRLGSTPLDDARSLTGNGILDGETLYLNLADQTMPTIDFDDSIAGLGAGIDSLPSRWRPVYTRRLLLGLALVPLAIALLVIVLRHPRPAIGAALAATISIGCLVTSAFASRSWADRPLSLILGLGAMPFAPVAGALLLEALGPVPLVSPAVGMAGAALLFSAASVADRAVGGIWVGFTGVAFASALVSLCCALGLIVGWNVNETLALLMVVTCVSMDLLVGVACRFAGAWLPSLPRNSDELEEGIEPIPAQDALTKAAQVETYLGALVCGGASLLIVASVVLAGEGGFTLALVLVCAAASLLRSRVFEGWYQRAPLIVAGLSAPVALVMGLAFSGGDRWVWVTVASVLCSGFLLAAAVVLPGRRAIPHYARTAELLEGVAAAALLPLLLAVLGTYSSARNLF